MLLPEHYISEGEKKSLKILKPSETGKKISSMCHGICQMNVLKQIQSWLQHVTLLLNSFPLMSPEPYGATGTYTGLTSPVLCSQKSLPLYECNYQPHLQISLLMALFLMETLPQQYNFLQQSPITTTRCRFIIITWYRKENTAVLNLAIAC